MRIAQVSPLIESVPPQLYGGTERVVSYLTEELVRQGHEVTLYATGDSVTSARLVPVTPRALRLDESVKDPLAHQVRMVDRVARDADSYDVIHFHIDYLHYPMLRHVPTPTLTTLHGRLDIPDLVALYRDFPDAPVVSISDAQRLPLPWLKWQATIHHGLPHLAITPNLAPGRYLAFLGRVSREKGIERAIEIARGAEMPLKVAAKIDDVDKRYFRRDIAPLLERAHVEFIGELGEDDKLAFLGHAAALVFPIDWPEPFGLVMIEAMSCGTPVVAYRRGSVAEVIEDGVSGFVVDEIGPAVAAVRRAVRLPRAAVRAAFERRFTVDRMARDYIRVYERAIAASRGMGWTPATLTVADSVGIPIAGAPSDDPTQVAANDPRPTARTDEAASAG
ncbi:MAG TPA: glycosyltransferase family 4 protein [Candidatus Dormibacteraeota bacterium]|nr:glycosyltransferase family 4 protein [Candidatus Dormibacteraeota bacterium]